MPSTDATPALIFLGCILAILIVLPVVYWLIKKCIHRAPELPQYQTLESSDEEVNEENEIPTDQLEKKGDNELSKKYISTDRHAEKKVANIVSKNSTSTDWQKNTADGEVFEKYLRATNITEDKEIHTMQEHHHKGTPKSSLKDSAIRTKLDLQLIYRDESKQLSVFINGVRDIKHMKYGGPQQIKFSVKLFNQDLQYKKWLRTDFFKVTDSIPSPFVFDDVDPQMIRTSTLKIKMRGSRRKYVLKNETLVLGATYIPLGNFLSMAGSIDQLVRPLFPDETEL